MRYELESTASVLVCLGAWVRVSWLRQSLALVFNALYFVVDGVDFFQQRLEQVSEEKYIQRPGCANLNGVKAHLRKRISTLLFLCNT
jgi:hypothetical protein